MLIPSVVRRLYCVVACYRNLLGITAIMTLVLQFMRDLSTCKNKNDVVHEMFSVRHVGQVLGSK